MAKLCIVLVDPLGDFLFSGESMIASNTAAPPLEPEIDVDVDEPCPETKRSATSESGIFASAPVRPAPDQDAVDTLPEQNPDEIRSSRPRAA